MAIMERTDYRPSSCNTLVVIVPQGVDPRAFESRILYAEKLLRTEQTQVLPCHYNQSQDLATLLYTLAYLNGKDPQKLYAEMQRTLSELSSMLLVLTQTLEERDIHTLETRDAKIKPLVDGIRAMLSPWVGHATSNTQCTRTNRHTRTYEQPRTPTRTLATLLPDCQRRSRTHLHWGQRSTGRCGAWSGSTAVGRTDMFHGSGGSIV